jgi:hypothetical protein
MRTFEQKPKAPEQVISVNSPRHYPAHPTHNHERNSILHLQRTIGNQAVQRLLEANTSSIEEDSITDNASVFHDFSRMPAHTKADAEIQPKLRIGTPGDIYEQEADHVAEQVLRTPEPAVGSSDQKEGSSRAIKGSDQSPSSHERSFLETRFGHDFSHVRIHADSRSAEMADALNADAFTVGSDIYLGAAKLQPWTTESDRLLAHELVHVMQQSHTGPALQPKLKITGKAADITRVITLLNSQLFGHAVSVDKAGNVSIVKNKAIGPPSTEQQAAASKLTTVINDPKDVIMTVSAGSKTIGGNYATGDFDIADLETYGVAGLVHEIEEQFQKQVKGLAFGTETTGAHSEAIKAESEVRGAKRGAQKVISSTANLDGTLDAVIEIPHTFAGGKVKTMVMTVKRNDIVSVTWK